MTREYQSLPQWEEKIHFLSQMDNPYGDEPLYNDPHNLLPSMGEIMFVGHHQEPCFHGEWDRTNWRKYSPFGKNVHVLLERVLSSIYPSKPYTDTFSEYFWNTNLIKLDAHVLAGETVFRHVDEWVDILIYEISHVIQPKIVVLLGRQKLLDNTNIQKLLGLPKWISYGGSIGQAYERINPYTGESISFFYSYSPCSLHSEFFRYMDELVEGIVTEYHQ